MGIFYTILNIAGINTETIHILNSNIKIRCRIFIRTLVRHLVSEQMKRHLEISTGMHEHLHLKLHPFQTQIEGNSNDNIDTAPSTSRTRKRCVRYCASTTSVCQNVFTSALSVTLLFVMIVTNALQSQLLKILIN